MLVRTSAFGIHLKSYIWCNHEIFCGLQNPLRGRGNYSDIWVAHGAIQYDLSGCYHEGKVGLNVSSRVRCRHFTEQELN